jgi:hypothetical protein
MQGIVRAFLTVSVAAFLLAIPRQSFANDNCQRLETLAQQYAGVELTAYQKQIKAKMVVWYGRNCRGGRRTAEN